MTFYSKGLWLTCGFLPLRHFHASRRGDDSAHLLIANRLAFGLTAYALIKLVRGKIGWTDWQLLVISAMFVARFVWLSAG